MKTYDMQRVRDMMGLGTIDEAGFAQLSEARIRIFDNINTASRTLLESGVSESQTPEIFRLATVLTSDLEALYVAIDNDMVKDTQRLMADVAALESQSEYLMREARRVASVRAEQHKTGYAAALVLGFGTAIVVALAINARAK